MLTSIRCGDDLTRSTTEELTVNQAGGETTGYYLPNSDESLTTCSGGARLIQSLPQGSGTTVSGGLGSSCGPDQQVLDCHGAAVLKMVRSVVSVSLLDGDTNVFTCPGIPVGRNLPSIRILTSANSVRTMRSKKKPGSAMRIEVRDAFNNVVPACLEHCDFEHGTAFVIVTRFLDVCEVHLRPGVEFCPHSDLVAIQLTDCAGGINGVLTKASSTSERDQVLCKAGDGGPLFDGDGNFVGMNLFIDNGRCKFVPSSVIAEQIEQFEKMIELRARRRQGPFRPRDISMSLRRLRPEKFVLI